MSICQYCTNFIPTGSIYYKPKCKENRAMRKDGMGVNSMISLFVECSGFIQDERYKED